MPGTGRTRRGERRYGCVRLGRHFSRRCSRASRRLASCAPKLRERAARAHLERGRGRKAVAKRVGVGHRAVELDRAVGSLQKPVRRGPRSSRSVRRGTGEEQARALEIALQVALQVTLLPRRGVCTRYRRSPSRPGALRLRQVFAGRPCGEEADIRAGGQTETHLHETRLQVPFPPVQQGRLSAR